MRPSRAACSSWYSLKKASTHLVLTFWPLASATSCGSRLHDSAIAELTHLTSCRFASTGSPGGTQKLQMGRIGRASSPSTLVSSGAHSRRKTRVSGIMYALWMSSATSLTSFCFTSTARPDGRSRYATGIGILLSFFSELENASLARLHMHQLPDMTIKILEAMPVHEAMILGRTRRAA